MGTSTWVAADWDGQDLRVWHLQASAQKPEPAAITQASTRAEALEMLQRILKSDDAGGGSRPVFVPVFVNGLETHGGQNLPCMALPEAAPKAGALAHFPLFAQENPPAISAGAEAAIAGYISKHPEFDGILCVLGQTHVWAHLSAQEIVSCRAASTGALIAQAGPPVPSQATLNDKSFEARVADGMSRPENAVLAQASAQAGLCLATQSPQDIMSEFLGTVIGAELAAMRPYWLGQNVVVLGDNELAPLYIQALKSAYAPAQLESRIDMVLAGLAAWRD